MAATLAQVGSATGERRPSHKLVYFATLLFVLVYCLRPSDWIPGAATFPFAKIAGGVAIGAFLLSVLTHPKVKIFRYFETRLMLLLFLQMCLAVPFAIWRGGAFQNAMDFSKVVLILMSIVLSVTSLTRLRLLMFVQAASVVLMCILALGGQGPSIGSAVGPRLQGVVGGVFSNPNDFSFNIALVLPFAIGLLLTSRNIVMKLFWLLGTFVMLGTVVATYSRTGFLATGVALFMCVLYFGVRTPRHRWLLGLVFCGLLAAPLLLPAGYAGRISTIADPEEDVTGSAKARKELLTRSIEVTLKNPLFGVGMGNFQILSGSWHATHNSYTQLSADAGIPALILFFFLLRSGFSNTRRAMQTDPTEKGKLLAATLRASLAAFVVGAFFNNAIYHFYPYLLLAYATALQHLREASPSESSVMTPVQGEFARKSAARA